MHSVRPIGRALDPVTGTGKWPATVRYTAALLIVSISVLISLWLRPYSYTTPFLFFFPTVLIAAWIGGLRAGLLATGIATMAADYYLLPPYGRFSLDIGNVIRTVFFAAGLALICYAAEIIRERASSLISTQAELLDMCFDPIIMRDSDDRITYWNHGAERLYGWTRAEALGQVCPSLLKTVYPKPASEIMEAFRKTGRWEGELAHTRKDGTQVVVASRWTLKLNSGEGAAVLETNYDLTELNKTRLSLQSMEERAQMAGEAAGLGYWDWDLVNDEQVWSAKAKALLGLSSNSTMDYSTLLKAIHPEDRAKVESAIRAALERAEEYDVEFRSMWPDGKVHWIVAWGHAFHDADGTAVRMSGVAQDVTERKQVEEALRMSEKIAAVGRMAGALAHEINNPLDAVKNLVYLFGQTPGMDDSAREYVRLMDGEVARIQNIVANTLSFYRDSSAPVTVTLSEVLDSVLRLYARKIDRKQIHVEKRIECMLPVRGFPGELRQVFSNLVANAIEAMEMNGHLKLHVYASANWAGNDDRGLRVVIADNGHGIAPEVRARMFEPLFTTKGEQGTGLGLWLTQAIVRKHHGHIRLYSSVRPGHTGTCFCVFLPLESVRGEAAPETARHATV